MQPPKQKNQYILQFSALNRPQNMPKHNQPNLPSKVGLFSWYEKKTALCQLFRKSQHHLSPQPAFTPHIYRLQLWSVINQRLKSTIPNENHLVFSVIKQPISPEKRTPCTCGTLGNFSQFLQCLYLIHHPNCFQIQVFIRMRLQLKEN